uniref:Putative secreted protein n=1 Tax=Ixodes ricinus TaxID=34613 RepID=A0A6B0UF58_IXORI
MGFSLAFFFLFFYFWRLLTPFAPLDGIVNSFPLIMAKANSLYFVLPQPATTPIVFTTELRSSSDNCGVQMGGTSCPSASKGVFSCNMEMSFPCTMSTKLLC